MASGWYEKGCAKIAITLALTEVVIISKKISVKVLK